MRPHSQAKSNKLSSILSFPSQDNKRFHPPDSPGGTASGSDVPTNACVLGRVPISSGRSDSENDGGVQGGEDAQHQVRVAADQAGQGDFLQRSDNPGP